MLLIGRQVSVVILRAWRAEHAKAADHRVGCAQEHLSMKEIPEISTSKDDFILSRIPTYDFCAISAQ